MPSEDYIKEKLKELLEKADLMPVKMEDAETKIEKARKDEEEAKKLLDQTKKNIREINAELRERKRLLNKITSLRRKMQREKSSLEVEARINVPQRIRYYERQLKILKKDKEEEAERSKHGGKTKDEILEEAMKKAGVKDT